MTAVDVWVDSDGLVRGGWSPPTARRILAPKNGLTGIWSRPPIFDFGLDAEIQAPPAAEVLTLEEWARITGK